MYNIFLAVLIVAGIGLVAGIILALASSFFSVPKNEKEEQVLSALPGVNCGACGFSGCSGYAKALIKSEAKPNLCAPGGEAVCSIISKILGIKEESIEKKVAKVYCAGTYDHTLNKMEYQGIESCVAAGELFSGPKNCKYGCIGFGDCKKVCEYNAIEICNGVAHIDPEKCKGCFVCVKNCPKNIIKLVPYKKQAFIGCSNTDKGGQTKKACAIGCIGCTLCAKECPTSAITIENSLAKIDPVKCIGCGKCVKVCKSNCIVMI